MVANSARLKTGRIVPRDVAMSLFVDALQRDVALQAPGPARIDEVTFAATLSIAARSNVDVLIRTGGATRLNTFVLWDIAYAEQLEAIGC
jgi:undecaprenyl diphosphate synthase